MKAIVQYKGEVSKDHPGVYSVCLHGTTIIMYIIVRTCPQWGHFLSLGEDMEDFVIDDIISKQKPNQCAMLVYTESDKL